MPTHLVTYATPDMSISADILKQSARKNGIDKCYMWGRSALEQTEFYKENREILDTPRGSGLWCWKPFLVLDLMDRIPKGDFIIYSDAGVEFVNSINHISDRITDVWLFGNMWQHAHWCKADVPAAINPGLWSWSNYNKQAQASVMLFRNTDYARDFVKEWLYFCRKPQLINDDPSIAPNHPEFREHRHDQAIATTLAYLCGINLHWWPAMYNAGNFTYEKTGYPTTDDYPIMFHHHRRRDAEWTMTDPLNQHITNYFKKRYQI